jgi:phospholipid/cholesterol/gamma-HCH transport system permease protein
MLSSTGRTIRFAVQSIIATLSSQDGLRMTAAHAVSLTIRCAIPVFLVCTPIGAMFALQALELMHTVGVERMLAPVCTATIVRELSPGFAAVVVAMQGGAGIAAELGAMRASSEIDALEVMGVDPKRELAGPRILGAALAAPLLNASAMLCGVGGAYLTSILLGVPEALFRQTALDGIGVVDVWVSEGKCVLFGLVLGSVCAAVMRSPSCDESVAMID